MIIKILSILGALVAGLLIYAGLKKPEMEITREVLIKATPEKLFPFINNSQKSNDWMPWKDSDPGVNMTYTGPMEGVGSRSSWESKGKMGIGNAEVIQSVNNLTVKTKLEYTKPMVMSQIATISLTPSSKDETLVRWSVNGHNSFIFRLFGILYSMDKMVGGEFEKGLAKLKKMAEMEK